MGGDIRCWRNTWSFVGQPVSLRTGVYFYWTVKPRSPASSISCLNRALDSHLLPNYRLGCVRALIGLNGSGEAHRGPTTLQVQEPHFSSALGTQLFPEPGSRCSCALHLLPWLADRFSGADFRPALQCSFVSCPVSWADLRPVSQTRLQPPLLAGLSESILCLTIYLTLSGTVNRPHRSHQSSPVQTMWGCTRVTLVSQLVLSLEKLWFCCSLMGGLF